MTQKLPNPQPTDRAEVTLVLDSGKHGQSLGQVRTDPNRHDPLAGFTVELCKSLMLPPGLPDVMFQAATLASAGAFAVSILKAIPIPALQLAAAFIALVCYAVVIVLANQFPSVGPHAAVKSGLLALGGLIALYL
jgi:hypothetical protein